LIFATYWFIVAVLAFLPLYWFIPSARVRFFTLIVFCAFFHTHFAGPAGVAPIIFLGLMTFIVARIRHPAACLIGIATCVFALCFYKYTHFFISSVLAHINPALATQADLATTSFLPAAPPLAISFFVFEFIHYLYEVRKGGEPIRNFFDFAHFTLFFPSLVAGPIKRYTSFIPSLKVGLSSVNSQDIAHGMVQVACGFFKKSVLADNLTLYITYNAPRFSQITLAERWFFMVAVTLRVYLDFSGYSDMAIGFARMIGIRLPQNFNWPYLANNITELWQRWHISLSSWIKDYVYVPLGGSRKGNARKVFNGLFAFALCGLWHGAAWQYLLWGVYHGVGLLACGTYRKVLGPFGKWLGRFFDVVPIASWATTMAFFGLGCLLFFYPTDECCKMVQLLFVTMPVK
jgi:alginate O-acetyltransferase complex protein AlgI